MTIARGYGSLWVRPLLSHLFVYFIYFLLINFFFFTVVQVAIFEFGLQ